MLHGLKMAGRSGFLNVILGDLNVRLDFRGKTSIFKKRRSIFETVPSNTDMTV
jgi:hypothetical protein